MKRVVVRGPALSQSGYGEHTRFLLRALRSRKDLFEIFFINTNWGQTGWIWEDNEERRWMDLLLQKTIQYTQQGGQFDISLQITIPNEWEKIATTNIGVTAGIETTKIAPQWVEKSLQMDKIIVVSEHAKYGFVNTEYPAKNNATGEDFMAKTTCPVDVVNYPVKEIEPKPISLDLKYDFNFLTVGTWIPRKNLENTVKWFVEQFYDDEVGLIVKTSMARNCLQDREITSVRLQELLKEYKERKCEVYLLHGDISEEEMTGLYQHPKVRSFISLSHGEGFGLPLYEAAYNALPIIAPAWSGHCDFLYIPKKDSKEKVKNTAMFSSVSYDLKPVQESALWEGVIQKDSMWCFPKEWAAKKEMKAAIKNEKTLKSKAKKLQKYLKETFSAEQQYEKMCFSVNGKEEALDDDWLAQVESIVQEYA